MVWLVTIKVFLRNRLTVPPQYFLSLKRLFGCGQRPRQGSSGSKLFLMVCGSAARVDFLCVLRVLCGKLRFLQDRYGLHVHSLWPYFKNALPCPALPAAPADAFPDVTVAYGAVPMKLADAVASDDSWTAGFCWQASSGCFLLRTGLRTGRFLVEGGRRITVERNPAAEEERIVFHLLHSGMAAALRQRGLLVLHANVALTPSGAVMVSGRSGAGKSTTLAALLQRGCAMIADDVAVLRLGATGSVEVLPGIALMHLWEDAAGRLGLNTKGLPPHPLRPRKAAVAAPVVHADRFRCGLCIFWSVMALSGCVRIPWQARINS